MISSKPSHITDKGVYVITQDLNGLSCPNLVARQGLEPCALLRALSITPGLCDSWKETLLWIYLYMTFPLLSVDSSFYVGKLVLNLWVSYGVKCSFQICVISKLDNYADMAYTPPHTHTKCIRYMYLVQINNKAVEKPELGEASYAGFLENSLLSGKKLLISTLKTKVFGWVWLRLPFTDSSCPICDSLKHNS